MGFLNSLKDFIYSADVAIVPIFRGSGIKTKIIDYLSGSIPVITTREGAEGLLIRNGIHGYIVQNSVEDMIDKINILRNNQEKMVEYAIKQKQELVNLVLKNLSEEIDKGINKFKNNLDINIKKIEKTYHKNKKDLIELIIENLGLDF